MEQKDQISIRLSGQLKDDFYQFVENYQEANDTILKTDKAILEALIDVATSKYRPYRENSIKLSLLEKENEKLRSEIERLQSLEKTLKVVSTSKDNLEQEIASLKAELSGCILHKKELTIIHMRLIEKYLRDKTTQKLFAENNKNGKYNGFFDKLTENTSIGTFLRSVFMLSAIGKALPPVTKNANIFSTIDRYNENLSL